MASFTMTSIGVVRTSRSAIEDDGWDAETSRIELDAEHFLPESLAELGSFPHVEVKNRPNRIGLTVCRIERVAGLVVHVSGLDAIDGTPVLDLKPWVRELGPRGEVRQPAWMTELMAHYWE